MTKPEETANSNNKVPIELPISLMDEMISRIIEGRETFLVFYPTKPSEKPE